jgi:hypothetical protein
VFARIWFPSVPSA